VTQKNSASSEETASAATELSDLAKRLQQSLSRFVMKSNSQSPEGQQAAEVRKTNLLEV